MALTKRNQKKFTKRNDMLPSTKRNEISLFFVSRNKRNFAKQVFVSHSFVFRETEKRKRNGNPIWDTGTIANCTWKFIKMLLNVQKESGPRWKGDPFIGPGLKIHKNVTKCSERFGARWKGDHFIGPGQHLELSQE
jgi:hypothetical protein